MRLFADPLHDQFAGLATGWVTSGAADYGEIVAIAEAFPEGGDDAAYYEAWSAAAARHVERADEALGSGHELHRPGPPLPCGGLRRRRDQALVRGAGRPADDRGLRGLHGGVRPRHRPRAAAGRAADGAVRRLRAADLVRPRRRQRAGRGPPGRDRQQRLRRHPARDPFRDRQSRHRARLPRGALRRARPGGAAGARRHRPGRRLGAGGGRRSSTRSSTATTSTATASR